MIYKTSFTIALLAISLNSGAFASANNDEHKLVADIAGDGMLEVQLGKLAEKRAMNEDVQHFAKHMVTDHSKANEKLKEAAAADKIQLPSRLSTEQREKESKLSALSGSAFDQEYMQEMVAGHVKAIAAVQKESQTGSGRAKAWAAATLPVIKKHKQEAVGISSKL
jgi:putative membrane protein